MSRISDEDLILYYYGEAEDAHAIAARIEESSELRQRYAAICLVLDAVDSEPAAERPAAYGSRMWHRIAPEIEASGRRPRAWWLRPRREWALAAVLVLLLVTAFLAGRMIPRTDVQVASGLSNEGRDRILLMTVAGHLERSEMLLLELVNTTEDGEVDLSLERQLATELGHENRLYRQAAQRAGRADVATLLEQLETVLVELANAPETVAAADLGEFQMRLDDGDVLFRVRVVGSRLRHETEVPDRVAAPRSVPVDL